MVYINEDLEDEESEDEEKPEEKDELELKNEVNYLVCGIWHTREQHKRFNKLKIHPREPSHEMLEKLMDCWDKNNGKKESG